jgi:uncharacterized membrane protein YdjX (TVP38/TMEM64 family)
MAALFQKHVRASLLLLGALALLYGLSVTFERSFVEWQLHFGQFGAGSTSMLFFVAFAALSVLLGPFSSVPLIPFAVGSWGVHTTLFLLYSGWLCGGLVSYAAGYYWGYPLVQHIVALKKLDTWREQLSENVGLVFLLIFRIAAPSETGYLFGILRFPFLKYIGVTALAELPFAFLVVFAGDAFVSRNPFAFFGFAIAGIFLILLAVYLLYPRMRSRRV